VYTPAFRKTLGGGPGQQNQTLINFVATNFHSIPS
jgi:hypothetical protein